MKKNPIRRPKQKYWGHKLTEILRDKNKILFQKAVMVPTKQEHYFSLKL